MLHLRSSWRKRRGTFNLRLDLRKPGPSSRIVRLILVRPKFSFGEGFLFVTRKEEPLIMESVSCATKNKMLACYQEGKVA